MTTTLTASRPDAVPRPRRASRGPISWLLLAALFLVALAPRLYHVSSRYMTSADHNTANYSTYARNLVERGWIACRLGLVKDPYPADGSPPRFFSHHPATLGLLTSIVFVVLGVGEAAARLPALLASAATCPVLFLLFRRIIGPPCALLAALLFAFTPYAVYFGQMLNPEPFILLLGLLALLAWDRFRRSGDRKWWRAALVLLAAAALTDWPGTYIAPALAAASLISSRTRPHWRRLGLQAMAVAAGAAGLVFLHILLLKGSFHDLGQALSFRVLGGDQWTFTWPQYLREIWGQLGDALTPPLRAMAGTGLVLAAAAGAVTALAARRRPPSAASPGGRAGSPAALAAAMVISGSLHHVVFTNACHYNVHLTYYLVPTCLLLAASVPLIVFRALRLRLPRAAAATAGLLAAAPFLAPFAVASPASIDGLFTRFLSPGWSLRGLFIDRSIPEGRIVLSTGSQGSPQFRFYAWRQIFGNRRGAGAILGETGASYLLRERGIALPGDVEAFLADRPRTTLWASDLYSLSPGAPLPAESPTERPALQWTLSDFQFQDRLRLGLHAHAPSRIAVERTSWARRYLGVAWTPMSAAGRFVQASFVWERLAGESDMLLPVYSLVHEELGEAVHASVLWPLQSQDGDLAGLAPGGNATQEATFFFGEWLPEGNYILRAVVLEKDHLIPLGAPGREGYIGPYAELATVRLAFRD